MQITTIGLDIAKNVFQVHGIDAAEKVVVRKQLRRGQMLAFFKALPPCLVGMEACATSHYWARELTKLGHQVRLMPAKDVKAYVKRNKNDAADAEAICEAVRRPTMRFGQINALAEPLTFTHVKEIAAFAAEQRLPSTCGFREFCDAGGLLCYGSNLKLQFGRFGYFIDKILKGTKPGDIPIEEPTELELIVNARVAKSLGITLPTSILISAYQLIE